MNKKSTTSAADNTILNLKGLAKEKEIVRRKLVVTAKEKESVRLKLAITAEKLAITAKKLAVTAKEKEVVRRKLAITAEEKEGARLKLVVTARKLAATAEKLAATAEEKESVRRKLAITAEKLVLTAAKLAATAKEKESVRRKKLVATAEKLAATIEKLAATAKEKEIVRQKLVATAEKLAATAEKLAATAKEKEIVRRRLAITAEKLVLTAATLAVTANELSLTAENLAATAKEKEIVRRKLVATAKEKEIVRRKLVVTAKEKESVRLKLAVTAEKLVVTAAKLAVIAKEKEIVRRKLEVTAKKLRGSYETLEKKVFERTKDLEMARVKEEAILLSVGDGLLVTDEKGNITIINKTAENLFGKKSEEVLGRVFSEVIFLEDEKGFTVSSDKHPVSMALKTSIATTGPTYYYVRKDKTKFPMAIMATPVILNGKVIGAIKIFRDITSEREIDKAKTEFVSLASHQLRTPLSAVNWYAEMLLAGDVGELNEKQKKYLDEVYRSNQRMVELVSALLDVSSLELGTFAIEPESINVIKLVQSIVDEQKPQIDIKKIFFSSLFEKHIPYMQADPKHLRMVVQNILSNAVKYTPEGGKIKLSISLADKENILLKISDTGYGIPKNQQDKIFTKLFRADNVRDKDTDGTGLGLYIVKSIVENSGGKVWFKSLGREDSKGTTFYVTLPLDRTKKSARGKSATSSKPVEVDVLKEREVTQ
jgi:PAS domain S-box-containing protein